MKFSQTPCVVVGNLDIIRPLAMARLPIVLATSMANRPAFSSRFCEKKHQVPSPTRYPDAFVDKLIDIGRQLQAYKPVLFYSGDTDLIAISNRREELLPYFRFNMASRELIDQLTDKVKFTELADELNLQTPKTVIYNPGSGRSFSPSAIKYPCIIKPAVRGAWFGSQAIRKLNKPYKALHLESADALRKLLPLLDKSADAFLIQELVVGGEENIVSYHSYVDHAGTMRGEFTGRKIRTFPVYYGASSAVLVDDNDDVKRFGRDVIGRLGLRGVSKVDFKIDDRTGEMKLLEINPRFSLWNHPGARAGVNLELLAYRDMVGATDIQPPRVVRQVKWLDFELDALSVLEAHPKDALTLSSWTSWIKTLRGPKVYTQWSWNDPVPFLRHGLKRTLRILGSALRRTLRQGLKRALSNRHKITHGHL